MIYDNYGWKINNIVPYYVKHITSNLDEYNLTMEIDKKGDLVIHNKKARIEFLRFDKDGILSIHPIAFLMGYARSLIADTIQTFVGDFSLTERRGRYCLIIPKKTNSGFNVIRYSGGYRDYSLYGPNYSLKNHAHIFELENPLGGPMKIDIINRRPIANLIEKYPIKKETVKRKRRTKW